MKFPQLKMNLIILGSLTLLGNQQVVGDVEEACETNPIKVQNPVFNWNPRTSSVPGYPYSCELYLYFDSAQYITLKAKYTTSFYDSCNADASNFECDSSSSSYAKCPQLMYSTEFSDKGGVLFTDVVHITSSSYLHVKVCGIVEAAGSGPNITVVANSRKDSDTQYFILIGVPILSVGGSTVVCLITVCFVVRLLRQARERNDSDTDEETNRTESVNINEAFIADCDNMHLTGRMHFNQGNWRPPPRYEESVELRRETIQSTTNGNNNNRQNNVSDNIQRNSSEPQEVVCIEQEYQTQQLISASDSVNG